MAAHHLPKEVWLKLREAYRYAPGAHHRAGTFAGCSVGTATKAWVTGWAKDLDPEMQRPLSETIAEEQMHARARLVELEAETAALAAELEARRRADVNEKAKNDANASRIEEAQLIRVARGTVGDTLAGLANAARGALVLGRRIEDAMRSHVDLMDQKGETFGLKDAKEIVSLLKDTASAVKSITEAGHQAMQMERLLLGEPTSIVGHAHLRELTIEEAERRIAGAARALDRAKRNPKLLPASASTVDAPSSNVPAVAPALPRTG